MEPVTPPLEELGREVARLQDLQLERSEALEQARAGVLQSAAPRLSWPRRLLLVATPPAAAAAALLAVVLWPRAIELRSVPGLEARGSGEYLVASPRAPLPLRFSDGSAVDLEPGASARILGRSRRGVTLLLEGGRLAASVVHRANTDWRLRAGPFEVRVTGTRFDLEWNAEQGSLTLVGLQGSVVVIGCEPGRQISLATGQSLQASCQDGRLVLGSKSLAVQPPPVPPALPSVPALAPQASVAAPPARAARPPEPAPTPRPTSTWLRLSRDARYAEAWGAALAQGLEATCAEASAEEMVELADTARYAANFTGAKRVYLATRQRFPETPQAAAAAFNLGRLAMDADSATEAAGWFERAFAEQPGGPLAQESLGRLMESRHAGADTWGAWEAARKYLQLFPEGPHAPLARELVSR